MSTVRQNLDATFASDMEEELRRRGPIFTSVIDDMELQGNSLNSNDFQKAIETLIADEIPDDPPVCEKEGAKVLRERFMLDIIPFRLSLVDTCILALGGSEPFFNYPVQYNMKWCAFGKHWCPSQFIIDTTSNIFLIKPVSIPMTEFDCLDFCLLCYCKRYMAKCVDCGYVYYRFRLQPSSDVLAEGCNGCCSVCIRHRAISEPLTYVSERVERLYKPRKRGVCMSKMYRMPVKELQSFLGVERHSDWVNPRLDWRFYSMAYRLTSFESIDDIFGEEDDQT